MIMSGAGGSRSEKYMRNILKIIVIVIIINEDGGRVGLSLRENNERNSSKDSFGLRLLKL